MNSESGRPGQYIERIYWKVSPATVRGVLDHIRNGLVKLVAELRANMPSGAELPSADVANQAMNVVVRGWRPKVSVTSAQASGTGTAATADASTATITSDGGWSLGQKVGAAIAAVAAVAGIVFGAIQTF